MPWTEHNHGRFGVGPARALLLALGTCALLTLLPSAWLTPIRDLLQQALRPTQHAVRGLRAVCRDGSARLDGCLTDSARWAALRDRCRTLEEENQRLKAALETARLSRRSSKSDELPDTRLLTPHLHPAHVLGQQALAFLGRRQLLDAGSAAGIEPQALVLQVPAHLLDVGHDRQVQPGHLVLAAGRVWGRIAQVGACTSTVCTVWQPGYRDVVRVVSPGSDPQRGPRGLLEGIGEGQPRIRLVEVTHPVAVDDLVYTGAEQGILPEPLLYGRVARLERPVGAAHWEIWMHPAAEPDPTQAVAVLRMEVTPLRSLPNPKASSPDRRSQPAGPTASLSPATSRTGPKRDAR